MVARAYAAGRRSLFVQFIQLPIYQKVNDLQRVPRYTLGVRQSFD